MSGASAAAAAAAKKRQDEEEEEMTTYSKHDLDGWEFKILRSNFATFGNPQTLRNALKEEAESGWELVEKFDNARIRLKRKVTERENDDKKNLDPYRTVYGMGTAATVLVILGITFAGVFLLMLFIGLMTR